MEKVSLMLFVKFVGYSVVMAQAPQPSMPALLISGTKQQASSPAGMPPGRAAGTSAQVGLPQLPERAVYPAPPPSQRATAFAQNMSSFYAGGNFMKTPFVAEIDPLHPRPEHPKPQMYRNFRWESLNGPWQIDIGTDVKPTFGVDLPHDVIVPFPIESPLSGVAVRGQQYNNMVYRRLFAPSLAQPGERMLLHVERADWHAHVFFNGQPVGEHKGGYGSFTFDVTEFAKNYTNGAENEIVIQVGDPSEWGMQPIGKQRAWGTGGIVYTSVSGIWGDVWVEYVPQAYISDIWFLPDIDSGSVRVITNGSVHAIGMEYTLAIFENDTLVTTQNGTVGQPLDVDIPQPILWSPETPFLYNATAFLTTRVTGKNRVQSFTAAPDNLPPAQLPPGVQLDIVDTYFGLRKISLKNDANGRPRILLNNHFTFQVGFLDQGYVPDGIYTYATDSAVVHDLSFMKALGGRTIRKHAKVESDRWFLYAAQMGFLVWQDMPSGCGIENNWQFGDMSVLNGNKWGWDFPVGHMGCWNGNKTIGDDVKAQWRSEFSEIVQQHFYSPSIVQYVVFNEAWGQFDTPNVTKDSMHTLDPGTANESGNKAYHYLWTGASGWQDYEVGHVIDLHRYTSEQPTFIGPIRNPGNKTDRADFASSRAAVLGEYGGVKHKVDGHTWGDVQTMLANSQPSVEDPAELQRIYLDEMSWLGLMMLDPDNSLNAGVFTQPFDVEYEINGLQTYDRAVTKIDVDAYRAAAEAVIAQSTKVEFRA